MCAVKGYLSVKHVWYEYELLLSFMMVEVHDGDDLENTCSKIFKLICLK